jgi:hypothetical protein
MMKQRRKLGRFSVFLIVLLPVIVPLWPVGYALYRVGRCFSRKTPELKETVKILVPITEEITA